MFIVFDENENMETDRYSIVTKNKDKSVPNEDTNADGSMGYCDCIFPFFI